MRSVELFAGAGGLALGVARAGFKPKAVVEWDKWCCDTITENKAAGYKEVQSWPLTEGDVRDFSYAKLGAVDLVSGGPPCQPFSLGGKHQAYNDARDMFPQAVRAVRELKPQAFIFENVKGLTRSSFATYFEYIRLQLMYPDLVKMPGETWEEHLSGLERHHTHHHETGLEYRVVTRLLNAADYGVPQRRERVFFVGFRADLEIEWSFPEPTHSLESLAYSQWSTGEYWERHEVPLDERASRISDRQASLEAPLLLPWQTVRDAIFDLPDPEKFLRNSIPNHWHNPGARTYPGHTGSLLDEPAKTLKAGDHGVPGGENMLARADGTVRYFTVREAARLQTFPDDYVFHGSWTETMRQLGNAVPVLLGEVVAKSVRRQLHSAKKSRALQSAGEAEPRAKHR